MRDAKIIGTGIYVPERIVSNAELSRNLGEDIDEFVSTIVGIKERHIAADDESAADLAAAAAESALFEAGIVAAGGALIHAGLLVLLAAVVILLAQLGVTPWLSALIVAIAIMAIGYFMANGALTRLRNTNYAPTQTVETLKETTTWTTRTRA